MGKPKFQIPNTLRVLAVCFSRRLYLFGCFVLVSLRDSFHNFSSGFGFWSHYCNTRTIMGLYEVVKIRIISICISCFGIIGCFRAGTGSGLIIRGKSLHMKGVRPHSSQASLAIENSVQ